jgi:ADP-heptose:LPS heptosyltransferase
LILRIVKLVFFYILRTFFLVAKTIARPLTSTTKSSIKPTNKKIAIIKNDEIGDFILLLPLLQKLTSDPNVDVTVFTKKIYSEFSHLLPEKVKMVSLPDLSKINRIQKYLKIFIWSQSLRTTVFSHNPHLKKFDYLIAARIDSDESQHHLIGLFIPAVHRVGSHHDCLSPKRKRICTWAAFYDSLVISAPSFAHEFILNFEFLRFVAPEWKNFDFGNTPPFRIPGKSEKFLFEIKINKQDLSDILSQKYIVVSIGASRKDKVLPAPILKSFLFHLALKMKTPILITGLPHENFIPPEHNLIYDGRGLFSLFQLSHVIKTCSAFIGMDSGPLHIASLYNIPSVLISGFPEFSADLKTSNGHDVHAPYRFGPTSDKHLVISGNSQPFNSNQILQSLNFDAFIPEKAAQEVYQFLKIHN